MKKIPLFKLNYGEEELRAVQETIKSCWISMGPKCEELESKFKSMLTVQYACAVTNCTAALHLACCAVGIRPGDEVICPSLTFAATVNCIRYMGAVPVFCDIKGTDDLCLDANQIESLITEKTKAIIPMHFAGFPCDMDQVIHIAKKYNLFVIEDACHGPLSEYHGQKLGTIGDIGCFSFFSNKNISTGEGGMLVTNNETFYKKIKLLRSHGMTTMSYQRAAGHATDYDIEEIGFNYRMDDIRASLACVQLDKLNSDLKKRQLVRGWYESYLSDIEEITIPFRDYKEFVSNYIFPIVIKNSNKQKRDKIRKNLTENGIQTSVHYPAIHRFAAYASYARPLPMTDYVTDNEITLPMYGDLTRDDVQYICSALKNSIKL